MATFDIFNPDKGNQLIPFFTNAGSPTNGTSGTLAGVAPIGSLLVDSTVTGTTTGFYQNTGTVASPTWTALTTATGAGTYTGNFDGIIGANTPAASSVTTLIGSDATDATTSTAAAVKTAGGLAVAKKLNVGTIGTFGTGIVLSAGTVTSPVDAAVAAIGTDASNSYALVKEWTQVSTAASTAVGVVLPAATVGLRYRVSYAAGTAASIKVWPTSTNQIDAGGAGTNQVITKLKTIDFICWATGLWESHAMGAATS